MPGKAKKPSVPTASQSSVEKLDIFDPLYSAALLLRADIQCSNGCGCEEYDYCAADEWDRAQLKERVRG